MNVLRRLRSLVPHRGRLRRRVRGAVTVMAFTDSGWTRRFRVPKLSVAILAGLAIALTIVTVVSVSFAVWAGADLKRLAAIERENRSLATLLQDLKDRGLLCKDTHVNTIRLAPPLCITKDEVDWAMERLRSVLS